MIVIKPSSAARDLAEAYVNLIGNLLENNRPDFPRQSIAEALLVRGAGMLATEAGPEEAGRLLRLLAVAVEKPAPRGHA